MPRTRSRRHRASHVWLQPRMAGGTMCPPAKGGYSVVKERGVQYARAAGKQTRFTFHYHFKKRAPETRQKGLKIGWFEKLFLVLSDLLPKG